MEAKNSPFIYGVTVSKHSFTNRDEERKKLKNNLLQGINTTLISPRRWGKSSLVEKVADEIRKENDNTNIAIIDLFKVSSEEEFLELFAKELIKASSTKWEEWVESGRTFFKKLIPKISVGLDPFTDFSLSFDWQELKKNSDEVLNLSETIAVQKDIKIIVCLDEFQNLSTINDFEKFEKKLRANWQRHQHVTYCLYGSRRHMLTDIFNNPSKPFYRFGDIMLLQKIKKEKWVSFIMNGFAETGKQIEKKAATAIPTIMKNHSWYVQQLSHYTWNLTNEKAGIREVNLALHELINANTPLYQTGIEYTSNTQINFLKAVAKGETKFTSSEIMQKYALGTPRNVSKNKEVLIKNDVIHEVEGKYEFIDPAFELWFKKLFFNKSFDIK